MYKVKALSVGLPNNVIKHSGETINEGQIKPELANKLVEEGFLELMTNPILQAEQPKEVKKVITTKQPIVTEDIKKTDPTKDEIVD